MLLLDLHLELGQKKKPGAGKREEKKECLEEREHRNREETEAGACCLCVSLAE